MLKFLVTVAAIPALVFVGILGSDVQARADDMTKCNGNVITRSNGATQCIDRFAGWGEIRKSRAQKAKMQAEKKAAEAERRRKLPKVPTI